MNSNEVHDEVGVPGVLGTEFRVLRRDAHRTGVEVAGPHHHAAGHHQRCRGETELLGAEQRADHDIAAGFELAVDLDDDPVAQPVHQQRLLGLGQAELPGASRVLDRRERCRAGAAVVAEMSTTSALALLTPAATVPTPTSATSFTWMRATGLAHFRSWMSCLRSSML